MDRRTRKWISHTTWLARGAEHVGRSAALLHLAENGPDGLKTEISAPTMQRAINFIAKNGGEPRFGVDAADLLAEHDSFE